MYKKKKIEKRKNLTVLIVSLILLFTFSFKLNNITTERNKIDSNKLMISQPIAPFYIDDLGYGDYTWEEAVSEDWCSGSGTEYDPYLLEDLIIDGLGGSYCISIQNSKAFFTLRNCTLYNADEGLFLNNVTEGNIIENNCSNIFFAGIEFTACYNNSFSSNIISSISIVGIYGWDSSNNTISNNIVFDIDYGIVLAGCSSNEISGNKINDITGWYGISLWGCYPNNTVDRNEIYNCYGGIELDTSSNNKILRNNVTRTTNFCSIYMFSSDFNLISENNVNNNSFYGIFLESSYSNNLIENTIYNNTGDGVRLFGSNNNTLTDTIANNNTNYGINLESSDYNIISGGTANDNKGTASVNLDDSHNNTISDLTVKFNLYGISLLFASENMISHNIVNNNTGLGIGIAGSFNNTVQDNLVMYNPGIYGGIIISESYYTTVKDNDVFKNDLYGIYLDEDCDYSNITGNVVKDNAQYGVYIDNMADDNLFYDNYFINNGKHAVDYGSNNDWNTTMIGNYWDNYTGLDELPPFGIGDDPHDFGSGIDYLPIVDDVAPTITINYPTAGDAFGLTAPSFTVTVNEEHIHHMWYTLDGGINNYTFTENGIIEQSAWDALSPGTITLQFYVSDKPGHIGTDQVIIQKDLIAPIITINSPHLGDHFSTISPSFNLTITEPNLDSIWYTINESMQKYSCTENGTIDSNAWLGLLQGNISLQFYAKDVPGNIGTAEVNIIKDTEAPIIVIISPSLDEVFGKDAPTFNLTVTDLYLDEIWYSLDGGNTTFSATTTGTIDLEAWKAEAKGTVTITFYADDKAGNIGTAQITIRKKIPSKIIGLDFLTTGILLISSIAVISAISLLRYKKRII